MTQEEFNEMFIVAMAEYGKALDVQGEIPVLTTKEELEDNDVTLPGVRIVNGNAQYVQAALQLFVGEKGEKGDSLHYEDMTELEKQELANDIFSELEFASIETCESIIDELN